METEKVVMTLSKFVNSMSPSYQEFAELVQKEHRTLQQNMMKLFLACIKEWAKRAEDGRFDLRNEDTVKICKEISDLVGNKYLRHI